MLNKLQTLTILSVLFISTIALSQSTYFVSNTGKDSNNGLSENSAFKTLQHAADIVSQGDSVIALSGAYTGFDLRTSGTSSQPIVFKAKDIVTINQKNYKTNDGINIENADWIVIDGFNVINQPRAGIRIAVSNNVTIKNNSCSNNTYWGIFTGFTNDITIENNSCSYSQLQHGIYVSNSGDRPIVKNNICYQNNGCGIQLNADASQGGDGIISNAIIANNILHDNGNGGGSAINLDGVQESSIYNNLLYNNHSTGIALFMIDGAEGSKNNKVYNNTIINPSNSRWDIIAVDGSTGNTFYNNILINHHSFRGSIAVDESSRDKLVSDYNIVVDRLSTDNGDTNMKLSDWQALGFDTHSIIADADEKIFENLSSSDYKLKNGSQAIDKGSSLVSSIVIDDITGISRPQGNGFDVGAYEYANITAADDNMVSPNEFYLYQNYPNPFNPTTKIKYSIQAPPNLPFQRNPYGKREALVQLQVYDILGNVLTTLVNKYQSQGNYEVEFKAFDLPSGIYFYRLAVENFVLTKKMILLK